MSDQRQTLDGQNQCKCKQEFFSQMTSDCTGCPKKHVRCLSGYCEGAINAIFLSSRYLNGRDLNLEFGTEFE